MSGGITWSSDHIATTTEIVECFNWLEPDEILHHNWRTCGRDCEANWDPSDETYINGVMLTLDFDYIMGYLIQAVDRTSKQCTFIAIVHYHGRRKDGSIEHDWMTWPGTHRFGDRDDGVDPVDICRWAVSVIYGAVEAWEEARS